jgi:hypothetical protein
MRISRGLTLAIALAAAAVGGVTVGNLTAAPEPTPTPTPGIAAIPTSTPDTRTPGPARTLTPTQPPTASVAPTTAAPSAPAAVVATTPAPTATPSKVIGYFVAPGREPTSIESASAIEGQSDTQRIFRRIALLRAMKQVPSGYGNVLSFVKATLTDVTGEGSGLVSIGFAPPGGDWGIRPENVQLFVQQIVWTATEEPSVRSVRITQAGSPAVIAGTALDRAYGRAELRLAAGVLPTPTPTPTGKPVVYLARPGGDPVPVSVSGAGQGATRSDRVMSRLQALPKAPAASGDATNLLLRTTASVLGVSIDGDITTVDYVISAGTWGVGDEDQVRLLVQQIVWTATEEPGIRGVVIRDLFGRRMVEAEAWSVGVEHTRESVKR